MINNYRITINYGVIGGDFELCGASSLREVFMLLNEHLDEYEGRRELYYETGVVFHVDNITTETGRRYRLAVMPDPVTGDLELWFMNRSVKK